MQIKHSAIREYSDHLITFQSGLPHVSHQPLQDKSQSAPVREARSLCHQEPGLTSTDVLRAPVLDAPAQGSVFSSIKGTMPPAQRGMVWTEGAWEQAADS